MSTLSEGGEEGGGGRTRNRLSGFINVLIFQSKQRAAMRSISERRSRGRGEGERQDEEEEEEEDEEEELEVDDGYVCGGRGNRVT